MGFYVEYGGWREERTRIQISRMALWTSRGCVSLRSSRLQAIPPCTNKKWEFWNPDIKNAFSQADGFARDVFIQALVEWGPLCSDRVWKLRAPACGLTDAPVAFHRSVMRRISKSEDSMKRVGMRYQASSLDPCRFFIFHETGKAVGAFTDYIDEILGCG